MEEKSTQNKKIIEEGKRYNENKLRHDLIDPNAIDELAKVFTLGANKYEPRNWEKGMAWSKMLASLKRHINAWEKGEDYDKETNLYHMAHAAWNALGLVSYYKMFPQGDDRDHKYLKEKRIGLDIDDVLAVWVETFCELCKIPVPTNWNFGFPQHITRLVEGGADYNEIMANLPVKTKPEDIPFEPACYITSRSHTPVSLTEEWLAKNGFAQVPVIQTNDKLTTCREQNLDIFVDDKFDTFVHLNKNGVCCYLFDAPWNRRHEVGFKRIFSLKELFNV